MKKVLRLDEVLKEKHIQQKDTRENIIQLLKEYKAATKDLEINKPLNKDVRGTNGIDEV